MKELLTNVKFSTVKELKKCIQEETGHHGVMGYIEPGHGAKRKMNCLNDDEELKDMYVLYKRKNDVLLWIRDNVEGRTNEESTTAEAPPKKRSRKDTATTSGKIATTLEQVETAILKLKEKHGFSVEQYNCWAHMINTGIGLRMMTHQTFPFLRTLKERRKIVLKFPKSVPLALRMQC